MSNTYKSGSHSKYLFQKENSPLSGQRTVLFYNNTYLFFTGNFALCLYYTCFFIIFKVLTNYFQTMHSNNVTISSSMSNNLVFLSSGHNHIVYMLYSIYDKQYNVNNRLSTTVSSIIHKAIHADANMICKQYSASTFWLRNSLIKCTTLTINMAQLTKYKKPSTGTNVNPMLNADRTIHGQHSS